ncbi:MULTISPECIES: response regulator transcription factor [Microvirga]|uniref:response regulator transcription factor n=1 Tax=Microvirga TaxID=186650 RepID=UPI00191D1B4A|nr:MULTISPECIES: response regulator transcription factor [Microvirga]MBM6583265.1 response regulator transcription factor [Microvirga arvi]
MTQIRVALADDHPVVLAGVRALLQEAPEIELVGEAKNGAAALQMICEQLPDVAVIDISMPDLNGIDLAKRVASTCPQVKLLALTVHEDRAYVQPLLQAGARGYLLKRSAAEDLVRAIRAVAAGGVYLDPAVADRALSNAVRGSRGGMIPSDDVEALSQRETEVLKLTAQGYSNKEVAARLNISVKTIETYKARAAEKLGLRTRADIVRYGASQGWLVDLNHD